MMNSRLVIVCAGICLFSHCACTVAATVTRSDDVPLVAVIVDPSHYDQRRVTVVGYLHIEGQQVGLYLHSEDVNRLFKNAMLLDTSGLTERLAGSIKQLDGKYCLVEGVVDAKSDPVDSVWRAIIESITRLELFGEQDQQ